MSADLATLFIRVDSSGVITASKDLDTLAGKSKNVETATGSMNSGFDKLKALVYADKHLGPARTTQITA